MLRIEKLTELFNCPDGEQPWSCWLRALLEDTLVIDAPTIEPILTGAGELVRLDLIDGATIAPKIGYDGRKPQPPDVAYQQIVKGAPTVEFTADELIYYPRNRRTHKIYGYSPVEQILVLVNLALRREMWLLNFFTEGSIPEAYLGVPDTWTPDQIRQAQDAFDSYLAGNLRNRRKVVFGPDGKLQLLKADAIGGDAVLDELIVRMICFAFNVSPQALVKMMNRATAQTAKAQAAEEGLLPWLIYVADLMNSILRKYCKVTDLEFAWQDEKEEDPTEQAAIIKNLVSIGILTPNEARDRLGLDPVEGGDAALVYAASGPIPLAGIAEQHELRLQAQRQAATAPVENPVAPASTPAVAGASTPAQGSSDGTAGREATRTAGREASATKTHHCATHTKASGVLAKLAAELASFRCTKRGKPAAGSYAEAGNDKQRAAEARIAARLESFFAHQGLQLAHDAAAWYATQKAADNKKQPPFDDAPWKALADKLTPDLAIGFVEAAKQALQSLQIDDAAMWEQVQPRAVDWAQTHAAELITQISDTTREGINELVGKALTEGLAPGQLKSAIQESAVFSADRAEMCANTELANAHIEGTLGGWTECGLVAGSTWICDESPCPICEENEQAGMVKLGETFPSGHRGPTAHPRCECALSPVLTDEVEEEEPEEAEKVQKYSEDQPRDEQGRFGETEARRERAKRSHVPVTGAVLEKTHETEARVAQALGLEHIDGNEAFDAIGKDAAGKPVAVEVRTKQMGATGAGKDRLFMSGASRANKNKVGNEKYGGNFFTVAVDMRGEKEAYYVRQGVGGFSLSRMQRVETLRDARPIVLGKE